MVTHKPKRKTVDASGLLSNGWRHVASQRGRYHNINYWDHPQHQHDKHGFFTTSAAIAHQQQYERDGCCDCVRER